MQPLLTPALIIPALNEEDSIGATLERVPAGLFRVVVVADNGSTDRTAEIAAGCGAVVVREDKRGYGAACLRALRELPPEVDTAVFLQADLSEDPGDSEKLLAPLRRGEADLVIGSRVMGGAEPGALEPHQELGNRLVTTLVRLLYGYRYTDIGPFRAIRLDALRRLAMRDQTYGWTVEMQIRALQTGLRVLEVPVSYYRRVGQSKVSGSWWGSGKAGAKMLWVVLKLAVTHPRAPPPRES